MFKPTMVLIVASGLMACSTPEKQPLTAKQQVEGISQMCAKNSEAMQQRQQDRSLFLRLGGKEGIEKFSSQLYQNHKSNPKLDHMFKHVPEQPNVDNVTNFVIANSGGGGEYNGRSMALVHKDLGVTHIDFLEAGGDVQNALKSLGHGKNEIQEVICFLTSFVPTVVTK